LEPDARGPVPGLYGRLGVLVRFEVIGEAVGDKLEGSEGVMRLAVVEGVVHHDLKPFSGRLLSSCSA
jgi:hypothetical protein